MENKAENFRFSSSSTFFWYSLFSYTFLYCYRRSDFFGPLANLALKRRFSNFTKNFAIKSKIYGYFVPFVDQTIYTINLKKKKIWKKDFKNVSPIRCANIYNHLNKLTDDFSILFFVLVVVT